MSSTHEGPVRIGIIGPGWWSATMFIPALRAHPDAELVAICGRNQSRTEAFAAEHDIPHVFTDPDELFASGLIDGVIISTVNKTHHPLTMAALDAGIHVLCEKPLALDVGQAEEMTARAQETGLTCLVPFTYRNMPISRFVKRLIDEGYVGKPYLLNLRYYTGFGRDSAYAWRFDRDEAGAGVLGDLGSHWVDMAMWFLGEIEAVSCVLSHHVVRGARPDGAAYEQVDDGANILVEFTSGAQGVIVVSAVCHEDSSFGQTHQFDLFGSDGTVYAVNDWNSLQEVRGARSDEADIHVLPIPDDIWGDVRRDTVHNTYRDVFRNQDVLARGWVSAIRDGVPAEPDFAAGAAVQRVIAACELSAADGRRVRLDEIG
jgi:predicted dehydrogenase